MIHLDKIYDLIWDGVQVALQKSYACDDEGQEKIEAVLGEAQAVKTAANKVWEYLEKEGVC